MGSNDDASEPAIVLIAGTAPPVLLPPDADLGRVIKTAGATRDIADERMSHKHATVRWAVGGWTIRDLDSRNGTYVNGERIHGEVKRRGDVLVRLGHTIFVLVADGRGRGSDGPATPDDTVVGPELARVYDQIRTLAGGGVLLIQGGTGSGKQVAARVYHAASPHAGPFNAVACHALQGVAERLIFGGKKGVVDMIGHLQMARGGTLYLAGIADLDPAAQVSLHKLLVARDPNTIDTNIVCSSYDLRLAVADGKVREDLAAELSKVAVTLPPLRTRRVDLIRLIYLEAAEAGRSKGAEVELHARFIEACANRPWPGNVRELRAAVRHAVTRALADQRTVVRPEDLLDTAGLPPGASSAETAVERKSGAGIQTHSPEALAAALERSGRSLSVAARTLNLHRTQLAKLLDDAGIPYDDVDQED